MSYDAGAVLAYGYSIDLNNEGPFNRKVAESGMDVWDFIEGYLSKPPGKHLGMTDVGFLSGDEYDCQYLVYVKGAIHMTDKCTNTFVIPKQPHWDEIIKEEEYVSELVGHPVKFNWILAPYHG